MGLRDDVTAVREAVVGAVTSVWSGVTVTTEVPERFESGALAVIRLAGLVFDFESAVTDEATVRIEVLGRFGRGAGAIADDRLGRAESLRTALLGLLNPGGTGFGSVVKEMNFLDSGPGDDDAFDLTVSFECRVSVGRSSGGVSEVEEE